MCFVYFSTQISQPFVFAALGFALDFSVEEVVFSFLAWIGLFLQLGLGSFFAQMYDFCADPWLRFLRFFL